MFARLGQRLTAVGRSLVQRLGQRLLAATKPCTVPLVVGTLADLPRSKSGLIAENALLRHQLVILQRSVTRPRCTPQDRALLVLLASRVTAWRQALVIVQPDTLLRWHRHLFRLVWRRRSQPSSGTRKPRVLPETIALIQEMARANRSWGAERIRGELLKLDIRVAKWTIQKYMRAVRPPRRSGQTWAMFLHNHASDIWACDLLPVTDLLFQPLHAFFIIELATRQVQHVGVTRHPTDAWLSQQLREATPYGQHPRYLIRDNDAKYGAAFARVAAASGIEVVCTAYRAPKENAVCERLLGSVRRECLDHLLVLGEAHLRRILRAYVAYFNTERPHQGIGQQIPAPSTASAGNGGCIRAVPILGGLHHAYRRAA